MVKIISNKGEGDYTNKYIAKVLSSADRGFRIYLYTSFDTDYKYGDVVRITGTLELPDSAKNDKGFDYSKYLKTKKIVAIFFSEKVQYIKREKSVISKIYDIKLWCLNILDENFDSDEAGLLKAMLLGDRNDIDDETNEIFSNSNLSHILAISGLHITYIIFYIEFFLKKIINNIKIRNCFIVIFLIIFMIFVGSSPSAMRASIMMIICYVGKNFLREKDFYVSCISSIIIILLINPYNIYSVSMWLSFMGTLGIVLFSSFLEKILIKKFNIKNNLLKKIISIILVSVSAQIMIFPIMWFNFGSLSISFFISNLLVSELVAPILIIGYMSIFLFPIRKIIVVLEKVLVEIFLKLVLICSRLPLNKFYLPIPSIFTIAIYYACIFYFASFYNNNRFFVLKILLNKKYCKKFIESNRKILKHIVLIIAVIILVFQIISVIPKNLRINFIDVRSRRLHAY
jgi:ComEC/Rec2-related protein